MKQLTLAMAMAAALSGAAWAGEQAFTVRPTDLKAKPASDAATVLSLPERSAVELLTRQVSWMQVKAAAGVGWVKMLSLRMASPDALVKRTRQETDALFDVAARGNSKSNTGTVVRGLHVGGASAKASVPSPEQSDEIQADEMYESDPPDDTYEPTAVVAATMWGGAAGKLRNARVDAGLVDADPGLAMSLLDAQASAKAAKLQAQSVAYLDAKHGAPSLDTDPSIELALGRSMATAIRGAGEPIPNGKAQQYVNSVGLWLAAQTARPELPWQFVVLESEEVFVFPTPGGSVFLSQALLKRLRSEEELAGVLAQGIAHIVQGHHLWAIKKRAGSTQVASLAQELAQKTGETPVLTKLTAFGLELFAHGLKADKELEADAMAVVIAARAGYDPYGLPAVLQTLQALNPQDASVALLGKTHPPLTERLDALEKAMTDALHYVQAQPNLGARFRVARNTASN